MNELILIALNERYEKYLAERQRCLDAFSEDAIHDLRVAIRRILALVELLRAIDPAPRLEKLRRAFKTRLDSFDELRDTQVMLAEITSQREALPELAAIGAFLQKREKKLLKAAEKAVRGTKNKAVERRIEKIRAGLAVKSQGDDLTASLLAAVDQVCLTVNKRKGRVDPAQPPTIHRVRIAFKKFRYMLEIIHPMLPGFPPKLLKKMQNYQTAMGEIQDVEVLLRTLEEFSPRAENPALEPVFRFYEQRHAELIAAYLRRMDNFSAFWRATPQSAFPWEAQ